MFIASVKRAIENIRIEMKKMSTSSTIVYNMQPLVEATRQVIDLIERHGIPQFNIRPVAATDQATTQMLNDMSGQMHDILLISSRIMDEIVQNMNITMNKYVALDNEIQPLISDMEQRLYDIEQQTLEKVTNTSIYDHEVKNINFLKNVQTNNLTVINNTLMLPTAQQTRVPIADITFDIRKSTRAIKKLDQPIVATQDKSDTDTIIGTYFGNMIGRLDGGEPYKSENDTDPTVIFNQNLNESIIANYYSDSISDEFEIGAKLILAPGLQPNFIFTRANVSTRVAATIGSTTKDLITKNDIWAIPFNAESVVFILNQKFAQELKYQAIDIIDKATGTTVKRHNFFASMKHMFPDTMLRLNENITTSNIQVTPSQIMQVTDRYGFYKYNISILGIDIMQNIYSHVGIWESEYIVTDNPIVSVELTSDHYIPDEQVEYIRYEISFDRTTWYPIRSASAGITKFNVDKKKRIVLSNDNTSDDFLYIGKQANNRGIYLRVSMFTNDSLKTPVIHNLQLKIKVDNNEG